eukprot:CAMPEP_0196769640 /NCGR_PEP_ID=MMETSP1104-20130614/654_1 /TAXON_ID=33652 /ORGANISM="Cafeteria sp., Strain Caron Lab Isolate" /LENGTH=216 /DNA_ID=CAMNT_0042139737 /DNA_START=194 /DNA_END=844 /DNA_ORIENTATION=-
MVHLAARHLLSGDGAAEDGLGAVVPAAGLRGTDQVAEVEAEAGGGVVPLVEGGIAHVRGARQEPHVRRGEEAAQHAGAGDDDGVLVVVTDRHHVVRRLERGGGEGDQQVARVRLVRDLSGALGAVGLAVDAVLAALVVHSDSAVRVRGVRRRGAVAAVVEEEGLAASHLIPLAHVAGRVDVHGGVVLRLARSDQAVHGLDRDGSESDAADEEDGAH